MSPRRLLVATAITRYPQAPELDRPELIKDVALMEQVLGETFGYDRAPVLPPDPTGELLRTSLRDFAVDDCRDDDYVVLYLAGHGEILESGKHILLPSDHKPTDVLGRAVKTADIAEWMLEQTPLRRLMIILDCCYAGAGGTQLVKEAISGWDGQGSLVVITTTRPHQQAQPGVFTQAFARAVLNENRAAGGYAVPALNCQAIVDRIRNDVKVPGFQTPTPVVLGTGEDLYFLPNPEYSRYLVDLDIDTQERLRREQREYLHQRFLPAIQWFTGRHQALTDLTIWLISNNRDVRVVTGNPGSGKTALLGLLAALSDPERRPAVPREGLPEMLPPTGSFDSVIYAGTLPSASVLTNIAAAAGVRIDPSAPLSDRIRELIDALQRTKPLTILIDALDEAADPEDLSRYVLRPLMEKGGDRLRLLLGTREHLVPLLLPGSPQRKTDFTIDLDDRTYADPPSVRAYARRVLLQSHASSPYRTAPGEVLDGVADAVSEAADTSFLIARFVAQTLAAETRIADPSDAAWRHSLPRSASVAMSRDLRSRLGDKATMARELLLPLAYAQGVGLPWPVIWPQLANALNPGRTYTDDDLEWLRKFAGSYIKEGFDSIQSVYRLFHQSLAEHLREGRNLSDDHAAIAQALVDCVPPAGAGRRDWSSANLYILTHLASHAARGNRLDSLLLDPWYLVNAGSAGLMATLPGPRDPDAELAGRAYQRAVHQLRDQPEDDRLSYLELASRITRATRLTDRIAVSAPHRRWSVPWTHWPPEHPHRTLDRDLGLINGVVCATRGDGSPVVASIGQDARLRIWDLVTAEPCGIYPVGGSPLVAARAVRLPEYRTAIVLLAADGVLYLWDIAASAVKWEKPTARSWRRLASARNPKPTLSCLTAPDGQPFAIVGGRGGRASIWDLSTGRLITFLPAGVTAEAVEFATLTNGKVVVIASLRGARRWMYDVQTGHVLPDKHRRIPFPWLRTIYDAVRLTRITYYALRGGSPVVAVQARFFRKSTIVWDLTGSNPLEASPDAPVGQVQLRDGLIITIPPSNVQAAGSRISRRSRQPDKDPNTVVPLHVFANRPDRLDRKAHESLSLQLEMRGRFLHVEFHEGLEKAGGRTISLTLAGHTADITGYDWTRLSDGHVIVITASRDGTVRKWDVSAIGPESGEEDEQARVALHRIVSVRLGDGTPLGLTLAEGSSVALWDLRDGGLIGNLRWRTERPWVIGIAHPEIGTPTAVTFDADGRMRRWNLPDFRLAAEFPVDRLRWPSDAAFTRLPDGTCIAVTSGHGRRIAVWDVGTGRIRDVLTGHKGWSACVACALDHGLPVALTGGHDNRVNVWDLRRGQRRRHFRIVPPWTFLASPSAGRAHAMWTIELDGGGVVALVATSDGMVRALEPRRFPWGVRRLVVVPADAVATAVLSNDLAIVAAAGQDGIVRIWKPEFFTDGSDDNGLLCEINIEVPVSDISFVNRDMLVVATPNGLTAIQLDAALLEKEGIRS